MEVGKEIESIFTKKRYSIVRVGENRVWIDFGDEVTSIRVECITEGHRYQGYKLVE